MDKKKFIIILITSIVVLGIILSLYFILGPDETLGKYAGLSEEYKRYSAMFNLELVEDEDGKHYEIRGLSSAYIRGENSNLVIEFPETIDGIKVTKIVSKDNKFYDFRFIEKIKITKYINYIGTNPESGNISDEPFLSCVSLVNIEVDSENEVFTSIEGVLYSKDLSTLISCPSNSITLDDGEYFIKEEVTTIGGYAFYSNKKLVTINLQDNLTNIGANAFYNCDLLTTINFGENSKVSQIGSAAFANCDSLKSVVLPNSLLQLNSIVFNNCKSLENVYIPASVTTFGNDIFGASLKAVVTTSMDNLTFLRSKNDFLGIKNKDISTRIQGIE